MNDSLKTELRKIVASAVAEAFRSEMACLCRLSEEERKALPHAVGMWRDCGGGDVNQGIERNRETILFVMSVARLKRHIGYAIFTFLALSTIGGIGTLLYAGAKVVGLLNGGM